MVCDVAQMDQAVSEGHVRRTEAQGMVLVNYTDKCVYDEAWNRATLAARGLVYCAESFRLLARPFPKFFNYGEHARTRVPDLCMSGPVVVTEKLDGSAIITHATPDGGWGVHTRGSFDSEQAEWASTWLAENFPHFRPEPSLTYIFEAIYPGNRVVVDYGHTEGLWLLGTVDHATGRTSRSPGSWDGDVVQQYGGMDLDDALAATEEPNREGFVVHFVGSDERVKIKFAEYKRLHALISGVSTKAVWRMLRAGEDPVSEYVSAAAPDEVFGWVKDVTADLRTRHVALLADAAADFETIAGLVGIDDRKLFAEHAVSKDTKPFLFAMLDGHRGRLSDMAWRAVEPDWEPFSAVGEA